MYYVQQLLVLFLAYFEVFKNEMIRFFYILGYFFMGIEQEPSGLKWPPFYSPFILSLIPSTFSLDCLSTCHPNILCYLKSIFFRNESILNVFGNVSTVSILWGVVWGNFSVCSAYGGFCIFNTILGDVFRVDRACGEVSFAEYDDVLPVFQVEYRLYSRCFFVVPVEHTSLLQNPVWVNTTENNY